MTRSTMKWAAVAAVNVAAVLVGRLFLASLFLLHGVEDFSAFYTAGVIWHHFRGASLYDLHLQMEILRNLVGRAELPFYHPPYELVIFAPISLLPYRVALWCWRAVCVLALIPTSAMLARITDAKLSSRDVFLISVSFFPIMVCLLQGQDSILLLTIISASAFLYASGRDAQAGAFLAIGLFKFQFVLPIATILALRRKGRFTAGFVAAGSAIVAISIAMVRWEGAIQ